jgi:hypothetical protein
LIRSRTVPVGHTNKETINKRKPLTPLMMSVLREVGVNGRMSPKRWDGGRKNAARALMDRGLATPDAAGWWLLTEAGKALLASAPAA